MNAERESAVRRPLNHNQRAAHGERRRMVIARRGAAKARANDACRGGHEAPA